MEYVYAALLLHSSGKSVSDEGIKKVLEAAGVAVDEVRIKALVAALEGVDISKVLSQATAVPVAAAAVAAPVAAAAGAKAESKPAEEEEKKEEAEESGIEGLGALFG